MDQINISNDRYYDLHKDKAKGSLSNILRTSKQHTLPALQLRMPFYRINFSSNDLRCLHRPLLSKLLGVHPMLTPLQRFKRKKNRGREPSDVFRSIKDITLIDNTPNILLEYSVTLFPFSNHETFLSHSSYLKNRNKYRR